MHELQKLTMITIEVTGLLRDSKVKYVEGDIYKLNKLILRKVEKIINPKEEDINKIIKDTMYSFAYNREEFNDTGKGDDR